MGFCLTNVLLCCIIINIVIVEQSKKPVEQYYYSESEWARLGCGPLPDQRNRDKFQDAHAKGNPKIDGKVVKGYN